MAVNSYFENPENLPVENLKLSIKNDGIIKSIPALDAYWASKRSLSLYSPPPKEDKKSAADLQTWKEATEIFVDDLKWLLSLDYHKFWSNVMYHESCMDMLVSFLQEARPPYLELYKDKSVLNLYNLAYKKIFIIFSRLITNKESQDKWMEKEYLSKLIYNKFVFTIPIIFDLCLIYGTSNKNHITKLIELVFTLQPKYNDDLGVAIGFLQQVLQFVSAKFDTSLSTTLPEMFKGFSNNFGGLQAQSLNTKKNHLSLDGIRDLVLHILDASVTLKIFLDLHTPSHKTFRDKNFHTSVVNFYENIIPKIYEKIFELNQANDESVDDIYDYLDTMRGEWLYVYRMLLNTTVDDILSESNIEENVNIYLTIITDGISEKSFIKDYNTAYPVEDDLDIICQAYKKLDPVKRDFIMQAILSHYDDPPPLKKTIKFNDEYNLSSINEYDERFDIPTPAPSNDIPEELKTQSLISEVKDILPDLGDGYILKCLEHYSFNTERVINCLLEGNLDTSLQKLDPQLPIIPMDKLDEQFTKTGIDRINVFDNDEFDIMTRDHVDTSRIYRGKKKFQHKTLSDMLNDKSHIKDMKETYSKYSVLSDDDEYDDTYDDLGRNIVSEVTTEIEKRRPLSVHRQIEECRPESDDEPDEETANNEVSKDQFCVNPEVLRARYQARRDLKYGNKNSVQRDVVGKAKGQGQEKDVLLNRQKKGAQKSTRGNHNRRSGAQWKRSGGMVP